LILYPHPPFRARVWQLRENLSAYDALYLALGETLTDSVLLTGMRVSRQTPLTRSAIAASAISHRRDSFRRLPIVALPAIGETPGVWRSLVTRPDTARLDELQQCC
jgi:hypothetical protein